MATENGWLRANSQAMVASNGLQVSSLEYPHLSHDEIFTALEGFYKRFYFRPRKIAEISYEMLHSWAITKRRLREGAEFFKFLYGREDRA
jgi:hypothetical protein